MVVGAAVATAIGIAIAGAAHAYPHWSHAFILAVGLAIAWLWASYLCANLQLARDAHDLCLPRIEHDTDFCLLWFAVLSIALPILACRLTGVDPSLASAVFVAAAAIGLAYALLPFYVGLPLVMAIFLLAVTNRLALPTSLLWGFLAALAAFDLWRWWRLRHATSVQRDGWNAALVFYCYQQDSVRSGGWFSLERAFLRNCLGTPSHLDLRGIGPRAPVASLRLALGGLGMPKPLPAHLRDLAHVLGYALAIPLLFLALQGVIPHPRSEPVARVIRLHWIAPFLANCCVFSCCAVVFAFAGRCRALWRKADAELPLLSLLPGLGTAQQVKLHAALALLMPAGLVVAGIAAVLCLGAAGIGAGAWMYVSIWICCVGAFSLVVTSTLTVLGGKPMETATYVSLYVGLIALSILMVSLSLAPYAYHGPHPERIGVPPAWLWILWGAYFCVSGWLAREGRMALRERPHAFLSNAS